MRLYKTKKPDALRIASDIVFRRARAHEITGQARHLMPLAIGAKLQGPVLWLHASWEHTRLHAEGVRDHLNPGRIVFSTARNEMDLLWAAEEILRSGLVPLVILDLASPPNLTSIRRLHLAAQDGAGKDTTPIVFVLTPGAGGAPGVETRWRLDPMPSLASDNPCSWRLTRQRARSAPPREWEMRLSSSQHISVTSIRSEESESA